MSAIELNAQDKVNTHITSVLPPPQCPSTNPFIGGWHPETGIYEKDIDAEIQQAFANVDLCIKDAGGKGWSQVYRVNSYHVGLSNEALGIMSRELKKWMPDHKPIWTCVGVASLAEVEMRVEIEVVAHDPK